MGHASLIVPRGAAKARAYVCIPVDESLASRSSVISTLMDMEGFAELPDGIGVSDFLSWSDTRPEEASALSTEELSYALQIGDQLCDVHSEAWAQAIARKLVKTKWSDEEESEAMQVLILSLNTNSQGLVIRQLDQGNGMVAEVISKWPPALQQAYFDALVETGDITISSWHKAKQLQSILSHISRTPQASSGLQSLSVKGSIFTSSTAALLVRTLLQHSASLTHLAVPLLTCIASDDTLPAETVFLSLRRLSHLTLLKIGCTTPCNHTDAGAAKTAHALASSIAKLPNLAHFSLHNMNVTSAPPSVAAAAPPANKRRRLCTAAGSRPVTSLDPVIAALSTAPSLTALSFSCETHSAFTSPFPCSGIRGAFPALQQLSISISIRSAAKPKEPAMGEDRNMLPVEPLPALTLLEFDCGPRILQPSAVEMLVRGFVQQHKLREARLCLPSLPLAAAKLIEGGCGGLGHLAELELQLGDEACSSPAAVRVAAKGFAQLTALTRLQLQVEDKIVERDGSSGVMMDPVTEFGVAAMLEPLCTLAALQDLRFEAVEVEARGPRYSAANALVAPLGYFTQLTRLDVDVGCAGAGPGAAALAPQLRRLTGLRRLCAHRFEHEGVPEVRECLEHLSQLTHLDLCVSPVDAELLQCIGSCLKGMPGLQKVVMRSCVFSSEDDVELDSDWVTGLPALPCHAEYELSFYIEDIEEDVLDDVRRQLAEMGGVIDDCFENLHFRAKS